MKNQHPLAAFVSFDTIRGRNYVISLYRYVIGGEENLKMDGVMPTVKECGTDPSNLIWENISVKNSTRWKQSALLSCLFVFVIFIGLITIFLIKVNSGLDFEVDEQKSYTYA